MGYRTYQFQGFLPPVAGATKPFKRGSTIPIKFRIADKDGNPVSDAVATLVVYYLVDGAQAGEPEVVSTAAGDVGDQFRYDAAGDLYIFNLSTKDPSYLNYYTYRAVVTLDDGTTQSVDFSLKWPQDLDLSARGAACRRPLSRAQCWACRRARWWCTCRELPICRCGAERYGKGVALVVRGALLAPASTAESAPIRDGTASSDPRPRG